MQRGGASGASSGGAKKDHKKNKKKVPEATTAHFNADNIAETALMHCKLSLSCKSCSKIFSSAT